MADLEMNLAELESVKQTFKNNINSKGISTSSVEFRNMPNLINQMEKILPSQTKTVTPTETSQSVTADAGYKLTEVSVEAIPSDYIIPSGTIEITENNTYDVTNYASANVNVPSEEPNLITKEITENGTYTASDEGADGYSEVVVNVASGGGGGRTDGEYRCVAIDYDGTILKEEWLDTGDVFVLPNFPTHDKLIAQEWSSTAVIVNGEITVSDNDILCGVIYTTKSGLTEVDIVLDANTGLDVNFRMYGTKDWGDGVVNEELAHTYGNYGTYTITCNGSSFSVGTYNYLFLQTTTEPNNYVRNIRFANITAIPGYCLVNLMGLDHVTLPKEVSSVAGFNQLNIETVIVPSAVSSPPVCNTMYSLTSFVIPYGTTNFKQSSSFNAHLLQNIAFPNTMTTVSNLVSCFSLKRCISNVLNTTTTYANNCLVYAKFLNGECSLVKGTFQYKRCLKKVEFPNGCSQMASWTFNGCYNLQELNFSTAPSIPTVTTDFITGSFDPSLKIIVPDDLYDSWIVASGWSSWATYIVKASEA